MVMDRHASYIEQLRAKLLGDDFPDDIACSSPAEIEDCRILMESTRKKFAVCLDHVSSPPNTFLDRNPSELCSILSAMNARRSALTMTAPSGVDNVWFCVEDVLNRNVPGDLVETGVWKGGLTIFMRGILRAYGVTERIVWVADSFEGLPPPDPAACLEDAITYHLLQGVDHLKITLADVKSNFHRFGLLDSQVRFLPGLFQDTLPSAPIRQLSLLRLDGDWYDSTMVALENLYPKLSPGGYAIIDDYGLPLGCRRAVDEYRRTHGITEPMKWVNHQTVFWRCRA